MTQETQADNYTQLAIRITESSKERLRRFAEEDRRGLAREFEYLMELEAARRLETLTGNLHR